MSAWDAGLGRYGAALMESGLIAAQVFGVIFIAAGVMITLAGAFKKSDLKKDETDKAGEE